MTYRLIALGLGLLMLSTSVGLSLDLHICQGAVKSFSVFGKAKGCYELKPAAMSCAHRDVVPNPLSETSFNRPPCCQNDHLVFQSEADRIQTNVNVIVSQVVPCDLISRHVPGIPMVAENTLWKRYRPPGAPQDLRILFRTLLL